MLGCFFEGLGCVFNEGLWYFSTNYDVVVAEGLGRFSRKFRVL